MARELAPAGLRSGPKIFGSAAHSSGSKLPRHTSPGVIGLSGQTASGRTSECPCLPGAGNHPAPADR
ncbi:hypothetical protein C1X89_07525 [Pseudomonas sp. GP01-A8]|nr:hypothetical protein C1X90_14630 [Pseudomonas sp. GP01-A9]PMU42997.1 hypothetical protein C1X89_07525 [Pseudomonas sp. GP01-A8]PMU57796.1 hypothetical protein C1X85_02675 [Pseudomonas sp. GP01-A6]PMU62182.1 hypothetical protein C1X86_14405 [Pseudomonas sp. GP01-A3]PMU77453.1 hypothetical protein C1X81_06500 [Pseudomonas sp. FW215-L2]PMU84057.1 hypothetical protein C1X91_06865 [Pseudomonas sp. GP01-A5]PMV13148.1 hypothetical protein C1X83_09405 [Pseudomonas sp. GP01-A4]PMV15909.1 hypotheti